MKAFAGLYRELDATTSSLAKQAALQRYLQSATPADAAWAVYFLAGGKPRQLVASKVLRKLAQEDAGLPEWLFEESYDSVGDLAETIALLLPPPAGEHALGLALWVEQHLLPLRKLAAAGVAVLIATSDYEEAVQVADRAGFIVNALLFPYLNNAVRMFENGTASMDDIDTAMMGGCNFPMGPFALLDLVGLDTSVAILDALYDEFRDPNFAAAPALRRMVAAGQLGRKTKQGFRSY